MRRRGIPFGKPFKNQSTLSQEDMLHALEGLGLPLCTLELERVVAKYENGGKVDVPKMIADLSKSPEEKHREEENGDFGLRLNKRICKFRSDKKGYGQLH